MRYAAHSMMLGAGLSGSTDIQQACPVADVPGRTFEKRENRIKRERGTDGEDEQNKRIGETCFPMSVGVGPTVGRLRCSGCSVEPATSWLPGRRENRRRHRPMERRLAGDQRIGTPLATE